MIGSSEYGIHVRTSGLEFLATERIAYRKQMGKTFTIRASILVTDDGESISSTVLVYYSKRVRKPKAISL